jgi:Fe2+ or Zn2+ uptake regulation protein
MSETRELKDHGLKATFPRRKILELMESSEVRHFSAEDIYRMLLSNDFEIGLATVYRVLTQFEAAGMIVKHHLRKVIPFSNYLLICIMTTSFVCAAVELKNFTMMKSNLDNVTLQQAWVLN